MPVTLANAQTLPELFRARVQATPDKVAYRRFASGTQEWQAITWTDMALEVGRWQQVLRAAGLQPGECIAILLRNGPDWVLVDQAAMGLGLVTVPLYLEDRPDNLAFILEQTQTRWLVLEGRTQWRRLLPILESLPHLTQVIALQEIPDEPGQVPHARLQSAVQCLPARTALPEWQTMALPPDELATLVFTSGTTGRSKGVMLSHRNLLHNARAAAACAPMGEQDRFLSFLPLSHTLERTGGYILPMLIGAEVAFARSIPQLGEDLVTIRPTMLVSVPRIYESVYAKIQAGLRQKSPLARWLFRLTVDCGWARFEYRQGRGPYTPRLWLWPLLDRLVARTVLARLGGHLRFAVCGGAPLSPAIARFFLGLGLPVFHGYGLTEASPVVTVNRPEDNLPASIGTAIPGVEVALGEEDELLTRSPSVMLGYWKLPEATAAMIDAQGWLHTGDQARIDAQGHVFITGRLKDIIVLGNGEKVPPADMEMALQLDPLIDQALIIGEGRPFLSAILVLNPEEWARTATELGWLPDAPGVLEARATERALLARVNQQLRQFPGYARIRRLVLQRESWTVESGLLTPTMKMKRARILDQFAAEIAAIYADYADF
jgi:long-chain acyl-CoA synthetase